MNTQPISSEHPSDFVLDRAYADELDAEERGRFVAHLAECDACRARHEGLAAEHEAFLSQAPSLQAHAELVKALGQPGRSARTGRERAGTQRRAWRGTWLALSSACAVAASLWLVLAKPTTLVAPTTRSKGSAQLGFFIKHGSHVARGRSGSEVYPHDVLRFTYSSSEDVHLAIFGRDARGAMQYFPSQATSLALPAGMDVPLDFGLELDAEPGAERIYALFCPHAFDAQAVRLQLEAADAPSVPQACSLRVLHLQKRTGARP